MSLSDLISLLLDFEHVWHAGIVRVRSSPKGLHNHTVSRVEYEEESFSHTRSGSPLALAENVACPAVPSSSFYIASPSFLGAAVLLCAFS